MPGWGPINWITLLALIVAFVLGDVLSRIFTWHSLNYWIDRILPPTQTKDGK